MLRAHALRSGVSSALVTVFVTLVFSMSAMVTPFSSIALAKGNPSQKQLSFPLVPDPTMTNGSLCDLHDPDYERLRYGEQIPYCTRNVSRDLKTRIYMAYGVPSNCRSTYTIDHFIPLSLGGSNRIDNLWPESKVVKNLRPDLETNLYKKMEKGWITQAEAVRIVVEEKLNPKVENPEDLDICL